MAYTSGSHRTVFSGKYYLVFTWEETEYNVERNESTILWRLDLDATQGLMEGSATRTWRVNINGTDYSGTYSGITVNHGVLHISGTHTSTIPHNNDGTKTFSYTYSHEIKVQFASAYVGTVSGSSTGTLTTIPRATVPTLSKSSMDIGSTVNISVSGASSTFTHQLSYTFGAVGGVIATVDNAETVSFTPGSSPASPTIAQLAEQIKNASSGTCTITCTTYNNNGTTLIGSKSVTMTLTAPTSWKPTVSGVELSASRNVFGTSAAPVYAQNVDSVIVAFTALGSNGSEIRGATVQFQNKTYAATYNESIQKWVATTNTISASGDLTVGIVATDSRGRSSAALSPLPSVSVVAYNPPVNNLSVHRADINQVQNESGDYMIVTMNNSVSSVMIDGVEKNERTVVLQYTISGGSTQTATIVDPSSTPTPPVVPSAPNTAFISVPNNKTCAVTVTVSDKAGSTIRSTNLSVGYCTIDFLDGGRGINFGGTAVNENFVTNMDLVIGGKVKRKNLLENTHLLTEQTITEVTYTPQSDGGILVNNTVATAANRNAYYANSTFVGIPGHKYILSGCPAGGEVNGTNYYALYIARGSYAWYDRGTGVQFTYPSDVSNMSIIIRVYKSQVCSNKTFYPMIRDAGITDSTWEPYVPDYKDVFLGNETWASGQKFTGAVNHIVGLASMDIIGAITNLWNVTMPRVICGQHAGTNDGNGNYTFTAEISSDFLNLGVFAFAVIAKGWSALSDSLSIFVFHGVQGGRYPGKTTIYRGTAVNPQNNNHAMAPDVTISTGTTTINNNSVPIITTPVTLTFNCGDSNGCGYAVIPLIGGGVDAASGTNNLINIDSLSPYTS